MAEHGDRLPEAPSTLSTMINNGRPEPSITTIIERIRRRSSGSSADTQNDLCGAQLEAYGLNVAVFM